MRSRRGDLRAILAAVALAVSSTAGPVRAAEGQLTWAVHASMVPAWFDPAETSGVLTPFIFLYAIHDAMVKPMPGRKVAPSLAESWTVSPDGLVYEFVLRKGPKFHNGEPVTAEDVKFSFDRYRGVSATIFKQRVARVETPDAQTVRFVLKEPWPDFLSFYGTLMAGTGWVVPKAYVEKVGEEGFKRHPIGAGPYRFVSFTPGVELVLEAFDDYWRKPPSVKRLVFRSVPDDTTRVAMLKRGEADIGYVLAGPSAQETRDTPGLSLVPTYPPFPLWLSFTEQWDPRSPWSKQKVRLAANYALNRQAINEAMNLGYAKPTASIIPQDFDFAWKAPLYPYDPAKAKQLLAEAGYPNGFNGGDFFVDNVYAPTAEAALNDLAAIGIRAELRPLERAAFNGQLAEKKLRGIVFPTSGAFGNAATRIAEFVASSGRFAFGSDPEIDKLFQAQAAEVDTSKREAMLIQIQKMMYDKAMFAPLFEAPGLTGVGPRVAEPGLDLITNYSFSAPYEELRLKTP